MLNSAPVASGFSVSLYHDTTATGISFAEHVTDADNDPISITIIDAPTHGTFSPAGGAYQYVPDPLFAGADWLSYQANDGADQSNLAYVFFYVDNHDPFVDSDSFYLVHDTFVGDIDLASYASDPNNDPLTISVVDAPQHGQFTLGGDGKYTYTPNALFAGADYITFQATDPVNGGTVSNLGTLFFYVNNYEPFVDTDSFNLVHDTPLTGIDLNAYASDEDGDPLTFTIVDAPEHGQFTLGGDGKYTYTPAAQWTGSDYLTYQASDPVNGGTFSNLGYLYFNVNNYEPVATAGSYSLTHDQMLADIAFASDADDDALVFTVVSGPAHGVAWQGGDGKLKYEPDAGWTGTDTFTVKASDGLAESDTVEITITVTNSAPTATDGDLAIAHDAMLPSFDLMQYFADEDDDFLQVIIVDAPLHGELTQNADGTFFYAPEAGFIGTDSFTIKANDGLTDSNVALITIDVVPMVYLSGFAFGADQGETAEVIVYLSSATSQDVTVYYATSDGTAAAGEDYSSTSGILTILAGQTSATFSVSLSAQSESEGAKFFTVALSNPSNAGLGHAAQAEFTIFATLEEEEDPTPRLNVLSGQIDDLLADIAPLVADIDSRLDTMAQFRQAPTFSIQGYGLMHVNAMALIDGANGVLQFADAIITKAEEAASRSQGHKFRLEGIRADLETLWQQLEEIWVRIEQEKSVWQNDAGNFRSNFEIKQILLEVPQASVVAIQNDEDYEVVPGNAPGAVGDANVIYDFMTQLLDNVSSRHAEMEPIASDLAFYAIGYANGQVAIADYNLLVSNFGSRAYSNWYDIIGRDEDDDDGETAIAKANAARTLTLGDDYSLKGIQAMLSYFDAIVVEEGQFVVDLIAVLQNEGVTSGDPLTNLQIIHDELLEAHNAIVGF